MKRQMCAVMLASLMLVTAGGCSNKDNSSDELPELAEPVSTTPAVKPINQQSLKVQATIEDKSISPSRMVLVELYVDSDGNGEGLLGFGDTVVDVIVSEDKLYMELDSAHIIEITDITGHGYLFGIDISNPTQAGFTMSNDVPVSYSSAQGTIRIDTKYGASTNVYDQRTVMALTQLPIQEAVTYAIDFFTDSAQLDTTEQASDEVTPESFYIDDAYGVKIEGMNYSVGDTIDPNDYFQGLRPEGILQSSKYKEDNRVDFYHVSYISSTGRSVFTMASNYVQAIETNAKFEWDGIASGVEEKELKTLLGYKLSKKEIEEGVKAIDENIVVDAYEHNTFKCHVGSLNVELQLDKGILTRIYLYKDLGF